MSACLNSWYIVLGLDESKLKKNVKTEWSNLATSIHLNACKQIMNCFDHSYPNQCGCGHFVINDQSKLITVKSVRSIYPCVNHISRLGYRSVCKPKKTESDDRLHSNVSIGDPCHWMVSLSCQISRMIEWINIGMKQILSITRVFVYIHVK